MSKVYEIITNKIIEELEKGTVPWQRPWVGGASMNLVSKKPYRGINVWLTAASGYSSPYWVTYKQATDLGGNVKKGEKGTMVVFFKVYTKEQEEGEDDKRFALRYYTVFNTDQCENLKTPEQEKPLEFSPITQCEQVVNNMPKAPAITHSRAQAYYMPSADRVNMPNKEAFVGEPEYYSTLFHELVHSTGHKSRLDRHTKDKCNHMFGSQDYSKEELVAEMGATYLAGTCKIENKTLKNSAAYIHGWLKRLRSDTKILIQAAAQAQKASDYILNN